MSPRFVKCAFVSLALAALLAYAHASYIGDLGVTAGVHSAGLLGSYAGALSGGKALSELGLGKSNDGDIELETHDFGEHDGAQSAIEEHGASALGDHLSEHSFPADYGSDADEHTSEYADEGHHEVAEASEIHAQEHAAFGGGDGGGGGFEQHNQLHDFEHGVDGIEHQHFSQLHHEHAELSLHGHEELFDAKPVPGIDHGKGAFSYSTLYEFKDKLSEQ